MFTAIHDSGGKMQVQHPRQILCAVVMKCITFCAIDICPCLEAEAPLLRAIDKHATCVWSPLQSTFILSRPSRLRLGLSSSHMRPLAHVSACRMSTHYTFDALGRKITDLIAVTDDDLNSIKDV